MCFGFFFPPFFRTTKANHTKKIYQSQESKRKEREEEGKIDEAFVYFALILSFSSLFVLLYF